MRLKRFREEFEWDEILKNNREESELDKWSLLEKDLMNVVEKYKGQFGSDSYGVIDAVYQVMDGMFQKKECSITSAQMISWAGNCFQALSEKANHVSLGNFSINQFVFSSTPAFRSC